MKPLHEFPLFGGQNVRGLLAGFVMGGICCISMSAAQAQEPARNIGRMTCPGAEVSDKVYEEALLHAAREFLRSSDPNENPLSHVTFPLRSNGRFSRVHLAVWSGCLPYLQRIVTQLAHNGQDIPGFLETQWDQQTPMSYAIVQDRPEFVAFLLENGADPDAGSFVFTSSGGSGGLFSDGLGAAEISSFAFAGMFPNDRSVQVLMKHDPDRMERALREAERSRKQRREARAQSKAESEAKMRAIEEEIRNAEDIPNNKRLTHAEAVALQEPIQKLWEVERERLRDPALLGQNVVIRFSVDHSGRVKGAPRMVASSTSDRRFHELARRTVLRAQPLPLPEDRYVAGVELEVTFRR